MLGDEWRYAAVLPFEEAAALQSLQAESGGTLCLRFSKGVDRDLPAVLESIGPREDGRVVAVFRGTAYLRDLTLLRQQSAEIILNTMTGIRVPQEALRVVPRTVTGPEGSKTEVQTTGVYCVVGVKAVFKPAEVLYSGEGFVLVQPASSDKKRVLRSGDEVIVTARDLYDGKVVLE